MFALQDLLRVVKLLKTIFSQQPILKFGKTCCQILDTSIFGQKYDKIGAIACRFFDNFIKVRVDLV